MPIITQVDTDDQFSWDTRIQEFDDAGSLIASNVIYDNGIQIVRTYGLVEGETNLNPILTELRTDHNDVAGWSTIYTFTDIGNLDEVQQITEFDDGRVRTANYDDLFYLTVVEVDLGNAHSWSTRTMEGTLVGDAENYFDVGPLDWSSATIDIVNDNGTEEHIQISDGLENAHYQYDLSNVYDWEWKVTTYNADGTIFQTSTTLDSGLRFGTFYENGLKFQKLWYDLSDEFNWTQKATRFDENGDVTYRGIAFDNGVINERWYETGNMTSMSRADEVDAFNWDTIDTTFASSGLKSERTTTYDNGIVRVELWDQNGDRSLRSEVDVQDARSWDSRVTTYSDTGVVALSETTLDSGDEIIFAYQPDGDRDLRIQVDGDDSHTWAYRVTEYDDDGQNPTSSTYQSLDDVPEAYLSYLVLDTELG